MARRGEFEAAYACEYEHVAQSPTLGKLLWSLHIRYTNMLPFPLSRAPWLPMQVSFST